MKNIPLKLQLTALFACLFLLGSCTSDSPGATGPLPERDPPVTLLVNGPPAKGILAGSSKTMDTLIWIFHADSGYTYSVVTSSDSANVLEKVTTIGGQPMPTHLWASHHDTIDTLHFPCQTFGTYQLLVIGPSGTKTSTVLTSWRGLPSDFLLRDSFELDNSRAAAKTIRTDSSWQSRTLDGYGLPDGTVDVDWINFTVDSGYTYTVAILMDDAPQVDLFGDDTLPIPTTQSSTSLGRSTVRSVRVEVYHSGVRRIRLSGWRAASYQIAVYAKKGVTRPLASDSYESDNSLASAKPILADSSWQERSLFPKGSNNDTDFVAIAADSGWTYSLHLIDTSHNIAMQAFTRDSLLFRTYDSSFGGDRMLVVPGNRTCKLFVRLTQDSAHHRTAYQIAMTKKAGIPAWSVLEQGEPDHSIQDAMTIRLDATPVNRILSGIDTDWIRIPVAKDFQYTMDLTNNNQSNIEMQLIDGQGKLIQMFPSISHLQYAKLTYDSPDTHSVFLQIAPVEPYQGSSISYTVQATSRAMPPDRFEPDPSLSKASILESDLPLVDRYVTASDEDWMRINPDSGRTFSVIVETFNTSGNLQMQMFRKDSTLVNDMILYGGIRNLMTYKPDRKGELYLRILDGDTLNWLKRYKIRLENFPLDPTLPNDDTAHSIPLRPDGAMHTVVGDGSVHYYKVPIRADFGYEIKVACDSSAGLLVSHSYEYPEFDHTINSTFEGSNLTEYADFDGSMYLGTYASGPVLYHISVQEVAPDRFEPDNTLDMAVPLPIGSTMERTLTGGDVDWVVIDMPTNLTHLHCSATYPIQIEEFTADGDRVNNDALMSDQGGNESVRYFNNLTMTRRYFRVSLVGPDLLSSYTLRALSD